jgi:hypothetical protein
MITGRRNAISNFVRRFATIIDPVNRLYKIEEGLFGIFRWGSFRPLPRIDYVLIFRSFFAKCEACAFDGADDDPSAYYQVSLVYRRNRRIIVHETHSRREAFEFAARTAAALDLRLRDAAGKRGVGRWIHMTA